MDNVQGVVSPIRYACFPKITAGIIIYITDSDVIHLDLLGTHLLVVNTREAAFELFEKRSAIYSDRVRHPVAVCFLADLGVSAPHAYA